MQNMDLFWQKYIDLLTKKSIKLQNVHNCSIWTGSLDRLGYGRQWVKWPDGNKREERAHRVSFACKYKIKNIPLHDEHGKKLDVSHLCHNKACVNANHLILEAHEVNMERLHCVAQGFCTMNHTACLL